MVGVRNNRSQLYKLLGQLTTTDLGFLFKVWQSGAPLESTLPSLGAAPVGRGAGVPQVGVDTPPAVGEGTGTLLTRRVDGAIRCHGDVRYPVV